MEPPEYPLCIRHYVWPLAIQKFKWYASVLRDSLQSGRGKGGAMYTSSGSRKGSREAKEAGTLESKHSALSQVDSEGPLKQERTGFKPELVPLSQRPWSPCLLILPEHSNGGAWGRHHVTEEINS